jgi:hypothetical protein
MQETDAHAKVRELRDAIEQLAILYEGCKNPELADLLGVASDRGHDRLRFYRYEVERQKRVEMFLASFEDEDI